VKKKHKRASHSASEAQAPKRSSSDIPNMSDDPNRKVSY
jgi:hypothetical protein